MSNATCGLIPEAVNEQQVQAASSILLNALYMQAAFADYFDNERTKERTFYGLNNIESKVFLQFEIITLSQIPMMSDLRRFNYAESEDLKILGIEYKNGDGQLNIVLNKKVSRRPE